MRWYTKTLPLLLLLTCACVKQVSSPETDAPPQQVVRRIAVMPAGVMVESGAPPPTPEEFKELEAGVTALDLAVAEALVSNPKAHLLSEAEVDAHSKSYNASPVEQAMAIGKSVGADAVMLWGLDAYHERTGGDYGVQSPASVGFQYRLIHIESGQTLCASSFEETQQSASDNLLSFNTSAKRGFKWVPAAVLLQEGVNKKLPECDYVKRSADEEGEVQPVTEQKTAPSAPAKKLVVEPPAPAKSDPALSVELPPATPPPPSKEAAVSPAVPASAPVPVVAVAPTAAMRNEEVARFLEEWRQAWEASAGPKGDMEHYGAFYAADFTSANQDRKLWLSDKTKKNHAKQWIHLKISNVSISDSPGGGELLVSFTQDYSSSNYSEASSKSLVLRKNENNWEIVSER